MTSIHPNISNGHEATTDDVFRKLVLEASLSETKAPNQVVEIIREHVGIDPIEAAEAADRFDNEFRQLAFQVALDTFLGGAGREHEIIGVACPVANPRFELTLAHLFTPESLTWAGATLGPPMWERMECGYERWMRCLEQGLILLDDNGEKAAIWIATSWPNPSWTVRHITVVSKDPGHVRRILKELHELTLVSAPYKGEMFRPRYDGGPLFMPRPEPMTADDVIMPAGLLERIDQHAVGITLGAERLGAAEQHLKRGLLLYGPPGTGKTHTLRYLASKLPARTTIMVVDPFSLGIVKPYLEYVGSSAMVLLDDIDSIASARSLPGVRRELFELLDVLDGLHGHGDVLFVMTTNRLDALEPAVSARPGRIDEALEIPRPDADCRRRLFDRYSQGMDLDIDEAQIAQVVERTEGVTGSFTKELFRRATVVAVDRGASAGPDDRVTVSGGDLLKSLDEMLDPDNPVTRLLLGAEPEHAMHKVVVTTGGTK